MIDKDHPLILKNPAGPLYVIILGRLSKPKPDAEETEETIESSLDAAKEYLERVYKGPIEFKFSGEQISGMVAGRATILESYDLVETGEWDLVLVEELRCIYRNPRLQYVFVQDMFDLQTRFISIVDNIDTGEENWETMLSIATVRHGMAVPDASRRVRRKAKHSFHAGGMVLRIRFGYRKVSKEDAKAGTFGPKGLREAKVPEATAIWSEIRRRLIESRDPVAVVAWLNAEKIAPGPYVKKGIWNVPLLKLAACDPKLHGTRLFRRVIHVRIFKTGHFRREVNPEPERQDVPELAHMTLEEQESIVAALGWQINWGPKPQIKPNPRRGIGRYITLWPGNAALCLACIGKMVISGDHLRCPRCLKVNGRTCWNRVEVKLETMREMVHAWLLEQFHAFPRARNAFVEAAWKIMQERRRKIDSKTSTQQNDVKRAEAECARLTQAIKVGKDLGLEVDLESLVTSLADATKTLKQLRKKLSAPSELDNAATSCQSKEEVNARIGEVLRNLMHTSFEFNEVMRRFFPNFVIVPVQALDSGQVHARGKLRFQVEAPSPESPSGQWVEVVMDFFTPPVHIRLLPQILEARSKVDPKTGRAPSYVKIAPLVGTSYMTVKRALGYDRLMKEAGMTEPFRELTERPESASRWHPRTSPPDDQAA